MAAVTLSPLFIKSYDRALQRQAQQGGMLKTTVRVETGVMAEDHRFPGVGKAIARTRAALQPIMPDPTTKVKPVATLEPKEHYEFLDEYEIARTNVNMATAMGMNSRDAVERACDQWIIDAAGGRSSTQTPSAEALGTMNSDIDPATAGITLDKVRMAMTALLKKGVTRSEMMTCAYPQDEFENIASINELISRDFSERGFIATGQPPPLFGLRWVGIEDREEGGIAAPATAPDYGFALIYTKKSIGLALGNVENMRDISWRNDYNMMQIGAKLLGGAVAIDRDRQIRIRLQTT